MTAEDLSVRAADYLRRLTQYPDRHVGGPGNRAATEMFAETVGGLGFDVTRTSFDCLEWEHGDARIEVGDERFDAHVGPYSPAFDGAAPLIAVSSGDELEHADIAGRILLLHGGIAAGQLMPKNFTFYNPEGHKRIIAAIEAGRPAAVVAATGRDPQLVGSQYPFPLFEDGDFDIPNAYMKDVDGERLRRRAGSDARLSIESRRVPATAEHVVATLPGSMRGRIVVTAHIDSRKGSPGALDNASGVATVLLLAELVGSLGSERPSVELVPFNGEDNYANPGEMMWVRENEGRFDDIILGINIDDSGQRDTIDHVSFYGCPQHIEVAVRNAMAGYDRVDEGPQWFQSDHAIFGIYGRPAIAVASSDMHGFMAAYAHTDGDTIDLADPTLVAEAAMFLSEVVRDVAEPV